jgi:hypothetical protein|tara:strand:+ start:3445 stop:4248 length:804 start_codon:yes stop_codon:yes gene_type:complete
MIEVLTTFHKAGWEQYGKRMVETFLAHWPENIKIHLYCENVSTGLSHSRVVEHDIFNTCPQIKKYLSQYNTDYNNGIRDGKRDFKYDAIKFCYKVFAQCHRIKSSDADTLIFIDADTVTFAEPPIEKINALLPSNNFTAYIGRPNNKKLPFAETGYIMYDLKHPNIKNFADVFENLYTSGQIFDLEYQVDCYTYDTARRIIEDRYDAKSNDITGPQGLGKKHPFVNTILGTFMDHLKGNERKTKGRSNIDDFKDKVKAERKKQEYWQ